MNAIAWWQIHRVGWHFSIALLLASILVFVSPALAACFAFVRRRLRIKGRIPECGFGVYFAGMSVSIWLMAGGVYSGGETLLRAETNAPALPASSISVSPEAQLAGVRAGQQLFLKNCAHCHGADAHGDDGPDLHALDWTDEQIVTRIRNGKKGLMPVFAGKLSPEDITKVITYLRTLK
jgi:mono/diheme cytochrome c family protein